MKNSTIFFNRCFDKTRLKNFVLWFFNQYGAYETIQLIENLKNTGFEYATKTGISLGIDDLKIPLIKAKNILDTEKKTQQIESSYKKGNLTEIERKQQFVEEWNFASENLKTSVIQFFKATNIFNPIYMIAFSGARGNISQVRQLIGMRGLMVDPEGQVLEFPIRSNFREGLNLTEYIISCYGARKGVVDTALRTATSGYLTRRLVDVTQHVIIGKQNCQTKNGIQFTSLMEGTKTLLPIKDRLIGRILLKDFFDTHPITKTKIKIASKNQEISSRLSIKISQSNKPVLLRSPLCCNSKNFICQLCYGWSLAQSTIVSIGEAVGVLAAQSIGEPGTQLTMRTFHTGGVFTGGFIDQIYSPFEGKLEYLDSFRGKLIRTLNGQIGFLTKTKGRIKLQRTKNSLSKFVKREFQKLSISQQLKANISSSKNKNILFLLSQIYKIEYEFNFMKNKSNSFLIFNTPVYTTFLVRNGCNIHEKDLIAELPSASFFENRQQETEQEIFTSNSGQIFFENLVLIEKISREGTIQKLTYGLGSIWLIAGFFINRFFSKNLFPIHGDFIDIGSIAQKLQVLVERPFEIDLQIAYLFQKLNNFRNKSFTINKKISITNFDLLDNIFLNRSLFLIDFKKIYYRKHRYFILLSLDHLKLNFRKYKYVRFPFYLSKTSKFNSGFYKKEYRLGLNFNFSNNKKEASVFDKEKVSESNFLFYGILKFNTKLSKNFFYKLKFIKKIRANLKHPVASRKGIVKSKKIKINNNYFWVKFIDSNIYYKKYFTFFCWFYYSKIPKNSKLDLEFPINIRNFQINLSESKFNTNSLNVSNFENIKVFKYFLKYIHGKNFNFIFNSIKNEQFYKKFNWMSNFETFFILSNRQGSINFQLLSSCLILNNLRIKNYFLPNLNKKQIQQIINNIPYLTFFQNNFIKKPIFLNFNNLKTFYSKSFYSDIVKYFLILYKSKNVIFLKKSKLQTENLRIGYKVFFRTNLFLDLKIQTENLSKETGLVNFKFQKPVFKKIFTSLFYKQNKKRLNLKKRQSLISWICFASDSNLLKKYNTVLETGSFFPSGIRFDNKEVIVDIIPIKLNKFLKNNIKHQLNFSWINNFKPRFFKKANFISELILFEKVIPNRRNNFNKLFLNSTFSNHKFLRLLIFNINKNCYNQFQKTHTQPERFANWFVFNNQIEEFNNRIFLKSEYLSNLIINLYLVDNYYIFLKSYCSIYQYLSQIDIFKNLQINNNIKHNLFEITCKSITFNLIKKFDFRIITNLSLKKQNLLKISYLILEPFCFKSLIQVKFFMNIKGAEIIQSGRKVDNLILVNQTNLKSFSFNKNFKIGEFLRYGNQISDQTFINESGQIIYIDKQKLIIRKATPFLVTSRSILNVYQNEVVNQNSRLFKFLYNKIKTGDIIQGIPKIEELFEARTTRGGTSLLKNLHFHLKQLFRDYSLRLSISEATQKSFEHIQQIIIDEIQKIYCSQGVFIADKHLEIVVRQMTSKVQILDGGITGLLSGELIEFDWARLINYKLGNRELIYEPIILGITKSCLETESFISAASFQETTRILSKAAVQHKIDFVRGLKQNVILGSLIPAGTGFFSPIYFKNMKDQKEIFDLSYF